MQLGPHIPEMLVNWYAKKKRRVNFLVSRFIPIYSGKKGNLQVAVTPVIPQIIKGSFISLEFHQRVRAV